MDQECKIGLTERWRADKLSHNIGILGIGMNNSHTWQDIQVNSAAVADIDRYSASASVLDLETVVYFLALQDIWFEPRSTQKLDVDRLEERQPAESASAYAIKSKEDSADISIPWSAVALIYLRIRLVRDIWNSVGEYINCQTKLTAKPKSGLVKVRYCSDPTRTR